MKNYFTATREWLKRALALDAESTQVEETDDEAALGALDDVIALLTEAHDRCQHPSLRTLQTYIASTLGFAENDRNVLMATSKDEEAS